MKQISSNHWLLKRPIAHRGYFDNSKGIIENSILSFLYAIKYNYPIELDLRITKYGEVIVFHDTNVKRLTGINKRVYNLTEEDINSIKYLNTSSKILKFNDLLKLVNGKVPIMIELKCNNNYKTFKKLSQKVNLLLKNYKGEYAIISFYPLIKTLFKNEYVGLIIPYKKNNIYFIYRVLNFIYNYDFLVFNIKTESNILRINKPKLFAVVKNETEKNKAIKNKGNIIFEPFT